MAKGLDKKKNVKKKGKTLKEKRAAKKEKKESFQVKQMNAQKDGKQHLHTNAFSHGGVVSNAWVQRRDFSSSSVWYF